MIQRAMVVRLILTHRMFKVFFLPVKRYGHHIFIIHDVCCQIG